MESRAGFFLWLSWSELVSYGPRDPSRLSRRWIEVPGVFGLGVQAENITYTFQYVKGVIPLMQRPGKMEKFWGFEEFLFFSEAKTI